jgi:antitoxin (DNA-binding transcriptional repressor) of toxin-antitoxin stability system
LTANVDLKVLHVKQPRHAKSNGPRSALELTELLDAVKKGRKVVITDGGRLVARPAPVARRRAFPELSSVRAAFRSPDPRLSQVVLEEREDRL